MKNLAYILALLLISPFAINAQNFTSSNLPIIVIDTHGTAIVDDPKITADMGVVDNGPGIRNNVGGPFNNYNGKIGIELHGSTSQDFPKKPYGIELRDNSGEGIDAPLLGMPKKDDWVLLASYDDKSLMRDALAYKLGRDEGHYASRTRYVELVINGQYQGVYLLIEKIKRDKNRVNISKLDPASTTGDALTGGYILKIDKFSGTQSATWQSVYSPVGGHSGKAIYFQVEYPKLGDLADEQFNYIQNYVGTFERALYSDDFANPETGYAKYMDLKSLIDYHILTELTKNPDGYRISTYFYKQKDSDGGKLFMGPIWDYNLGFGNVDYCTQGNPQGFVTAFNSICPDDDLQIPFWWSRLAKDFNFTNGTAARWSQLRRTVFTTDKVLAYIDSVAAVLNVEAQQRNFTTWPILGIYTWPNYFVGDTYQSEVDWLKAWVVNRMNWLDAQWVPVTGFEEPIKAFAFSAFPNPLTSDVLEIEYNIDAGGTIIIDEFDIYGRKLNHVVSEYANAGTYRMKLSQHNLPAGTYLLKATFNNQTAIQKLIRR